MVSCKDHFHYNWSLVWYLIVTTAGDNSGTTVLTEVPCEDEQCLNFMYGQHSKESLHTLLKYVVPICSNKRNLLRPREQYVESEYYLTVL